MSVIKEINAVSTLPTLLTVEVYADEDDARAVAGDYAASGAVLSAAAIAAAPRVKHEERDLLDRSLLR